MNPALAYQDVYLVPRYSELRSRSQADLSIEFLGRKFRLPVLPANMSSVINEDIAHWLSENDYPYIFHRFSDTLEFVEKANQNNPWKLISISVGVKEEDKNLLREIIMRGLRVDWITIDVANGHHILVKEMIEFIRGLKFRSCVLENRNNWSTHPIGYQPKIIAGNVATPEAVRDLDKWGADCVKVGIAQGRACRTFNETGFGVPMFSCSMNCAVMGGPPSIVHMLGRPYNPNESTFSFSRIPLILDGGVRENGDVAKALVAANGVPALVMAGSLFAACIDAPGENVVERVDEALGNNWGRLYDKIVAKRYHGSASYIQKGERKHVEGIQIEIPCNGLTYAEKYQEIRESLQSSCSYAGSNDLSGFKDVKWITIN